MQNLTELKFKNFSWINAAKPTKPRLLALQKKYNLAEEDILDSLPPLQCSKLAERPNYIFMILLFPVYDKQKCDIRSEEIDFFISKDWVITVHNDKMPVIVDLFKTCAKNKNASACGGDMANFLYELLDATLAYCFPMMRHFNLDLEDVENKLFNEYEKKETVNRIVRIKTNIFDFQRITQSHGYVLENLMETAGKLFPTKKLSNNFLHLVEYAREINLSLQSFKDTINALHEANTTLVEYRVNEIAKMLSIFAVIIFPLTLLSAIFGMNTAHTPIIGSSYDFLKIICIMIVGAAAMLGFFKWKKWF